MFAHNVSISYYITYIYQLRAMEPRRNKMDRYHGEWKLDTRHGKGVKTEHADAQPMIFHVEYEHGDLKASNYRERERSII